MKAILLTLALCAFLPAQTVTWTERHEADVEQCTIAFSTRLPQQTAIIGRTGVLETRVAAFISEDGHLLCPLIPSIDGEDAPYLLFKPDGSRIKLTTVAENNKRFIALLKLDNPPGDILPIKIAKVVDHTVVLPTLAPIAAVGEPVSLFVDHLEFPPIENAKAIRLDAIFAKKGSLVFDLSGALVATTLAPRATNTPALMITWIIVELPELDGIIADESTSKLPNLPQAVELTPEEIKETSTSPLSEARQRFLQNTHPSPLPCVLVSNVDSQATHSAIGTIVRSDGLILTKASELGSDLRVRYDGKNYPGVLLSTDEKTDLALVGIAATNMPTVKWSDSLPKAGSTLASPILLKESTDEMVAEPTSYAGTYSYVSEEGATTVHNTSKVTSLGLTTEQLDSTISIASIKKDTPAYESGLSPGDVIESIDENPIKSRVDLTKFLNTRNVGDKVTLMINRAGTAQEFSVELVSANLIPPTTGIKLSAQSQVIPMIPSIRRAPFPDVIVHTVPLNAWDCGSPLFDLQGRAIGLNIAAVSPARSIALQPAEVQAALARLLKKTRAF